MARPCTSRDPLAESLVGEARGSPRRPKGGHRPHRCRRSRVRRGRLGLGPAALPALQGRRPRRLGQRAAPPGAHTCRSALHLTAARALPRAPLPCNARAPAGRLPAAPARRSGGDRRGAPRRPAGGLPPDRRSPRPAGGDRARLAGALQARGTRDRRPLPALGTGARLSVTAAPAPWIASRRRARGGRLRHAGGVACARHALAVGVGLGADRRPLALQHGLALARA